MVISLVILPLFFTITLGGASGGEGFRFSPTAKVPIAFIDDDLSSASGRVYEALVVSGDFDNLVQGFGTENAIRALGTGRIFAAILVPSEFQKDLENGQRGRIVVYTDDGEPSVGESIVANMRVALKNFDPGLVVQSVGKGSSPDVQVVDKSRIFSGFSVGIAIVLAVVQIFATFYEIAGGISRDREEGTYARLLLSPAWLGSIILGKTLYDLVLNVVRTLTVLGLAVYVYGVRLNSGVMSVLAVSILIALITMGFGFLVSSLKLGVRSVVILEFFLVIILYSFSGMIIDRELLRGYSATISLLLPWSYGINVMRNTVLTRRPLLEMSYDLQVIGGSIVALYVLSYIFLALSREKLAT